MARPAHASPTPPPAHDETRWLATGGIAYGRMLALIDAARVSIRCETYIWRHDEIGDRFRAALVRAAGRGVRVRVLVDGVGSNALPAHYWRDLTDAGGHVRVFNPISLRHFALRDHRKLLLVDDAVAIVGGFNIAQEYDGDGVTRGWRDLGMELSDPAALRQLGESFDSLYRDHRLRHWLLRQVRRASLRWPLFYRRPGPILFSGPRLVANQFSRELLRALRHAQRVRIVSAYFAPSFRLRLALRRVARRGGTVELLLAGKSDVPLAQLAARTLYGSLLKAGVRIWEYQPQILHAKLAIVDQAVFAGTANLDARSMAINYELMVHLTDRRLADEACDLFAADLHHAQRITLADWRKTRTWLTRLRGAWARFLITKVDPWLARHQMRNIP
ncbi:MAG: phospholipase D-like domain-containing protein [Verrucomicrobia bacterium]|nr:phospholipase D-like domain-containing protein [Verrucomicrobiota bacterium]